MPATLPNHWQTALGDVDGDGDLDLVFTTIAEEQLFLNDGSGVFLDVTAARLPRLRSTTVDAVLADVDGDADLDLITADVGQHDRLLLNDGTGSFANAAPSRLESTWVGVASLTLGDLDGDGDLDLVTGSGDYGEAVEPDGRYLNDGRGNFVTAAAGRLPSILDDTTAVALGDVDGDGDLDVVFGNRLEQSRLFLNSGAAVFTDVTATHLPAAADPTSSLALGDVDKDGDLDLVIGNLGAPCRPYLNDGTGRFTDVSAARMPALARETRALALGDIDGDGDLDAVLGNGLARDEQEAVLVNDGSGKFTDESAARIPSSWAFPTASVALGDVDGDLDLAIGNDGVAGGRFNRLLVNDGTGKFSEGSLVYDYFRTSAIQFADIDGDGDLDVFCGDRDHHDKLYLNDGSGGFSNATWPRMPPTPARTVSLAAGDVDGDGDVDLVRGSGWAMPTLLINHHRQIWSSRLPKIGGPWTLEVFARPDYATAAQTAVPLLAAAPASIPLPPWGTLGLDPSSLVALPTLALPAPTGTAQLQLPIPNVPGLAGVTFHVQAVVLHGAGPTGTRLTNVLAERIIR